MCVCVCVSRCCHQCPLWGTGRWSWRHCVHIPWFRRRCYQHRTCWCKLLIVEPPSHPPSVTPSLSLSSLTHTISPFQIITARQISNNLGLKLNKSLKTFGYSLSSGVDVDANFYNGTCVLNVDTFTLCAHVQRGLWLQHDMNSKVKSHENTLFKLKSYCKWLPHLHQSLSLCTLWKRYSKVKLWV